MSSLRNPETFLRAYRPGQPNDALIEKAWRAAGDNPELKRRVEQQAAFDQQVVRAVQAIAVPEGLRERVCGGVAKGGRGRPPFAMAMYLAAACGVAIALALLVFTALEGQGKFPGKEPVTRLVLSANARNAHDLDPVTNRAGDLGDWFYVRGFEAYALPAELAAAPAVGAHVLRQEGTSVAQVAVDWHHALVYLFRADAFGVELPPGEWRQFQAENWQAALRKEGNTCTLVALQGEKQEMDDLLHGRNPK